MGVSFQKVDRRSFLKTGALAAGGLLIGFNLPGRRLSAQTGIGSGRFNAFVSVGTDDRVTVIIHKPENGQGTITSLSMLVAEELECDWSNIRWEFAPIDRVLRIPAPGNLWKHRHTEFLATAPGSRRHRA